MASSLDDAHAVLEEIAEVGPGGHFLGVDSTLERYKTGYYNSRVYPRFSMEQWQLEGQPSAQKVLREKTVELLANAPAPDDFEDLMARGEAFIAGLDL